MSAQHTPAPLAVHAESRSERLFMVADATGTATASYCTEGDAALYAAAPALLAACQQIMPSGIDITNANIADDLIIPLGVTMGELRKLSAAITKASGQDGGRG